ncbi:flagellar motor protein MotB [Hydrogenovibrio sp. 3SP14C1]|uniref:OmpA/MotB family protein n=1 Tax=Hydrogenovibrio sp. 3SP14C1 TaxID=3038774 RepID=UPI0024176B97|nr:flagellar motor protein MotB [Hydrogenovibrio sp. 3SP14C1]MDG4813376.1 flagellar motor protein MotB [Hydrogenovibrio sp. 3SP14C1]
MVKKSDDCPTWLATFADLMSLLMAVFVLLFAMSTLDAKKYEGIVESLTNTLGHGSGLNQVQLEYFKKTERINPIPSEQAKPELSSNLNQNSDSKPLPEKLKPLYESIAKTYERSQHDSNIEVTIDEDRQQVKVSFPERISFPTGEADLKPGFAAQLQKLKKHIDNTLLVKAIGHTDKRPISSGRFKSNWELSSARAAAVIQQLIDDRIITPDQAQVIGVADTHPVDDRDTEAAYALNRRVEIILIPHTHQHIKGQKIEIE